MATVYGGLITPRVPAQGFLPLPSQLPTLLLSTTNAFDFAGRMCAYHLFQQFEDGTLGCLLTCFRQLKFVVLVLLFRAQATILAVYFCMWGPPEWASGSN